MISAAGCHGYVLAAATAVQCPADANIHNCATSGLAVGDLCEGDGECGTDDDLDNCEHDGALQADIYVVTAAPACPTLVAIDESDCPDNSLSILENCDAVGLAAGDLCEGDGECGTDTGLNNCGSADVYRVEGGPTPTPTPRPTPTPTPTPKPTPHCILFIAIA